MKKKSFTKKMKNIIYPGLGVLIGTFIPILIFLFYLKNVHINDLEINFSYINFFTPIGFGILSLLISYLVFRAISSTSVYLGIFAIVDYYSKYISYNNNDAVRLTYLFFIIILFALLILIFFYTIFKDDYKNYIKEQITEFKKKLDIKTKNSDYILNIIYIVRTPDLWGVIENRETILKEMLKNCYYKYYSKNIVAEKKVEDQIDEINFLLPGYKRFLYAMSLAFITICILIINGIKFN